MRSLLATLLASLLAALAPSGAGAASASRDGAVPHYDHILVIVGENRSHATILRGGDAPQITALAKTYGSATQMYAERHPSEPNYVAMIGGDTFGIADDDAWYCVPGSRRPYCKGSSKPGFVRHMVDAPNLTTQLAARGLAWRAYLESIPAPGSLAIFSRATATAPPTLYAAKHNPFVNFVSVHRDPKLAREMVGFGALFSDLRAGRVPAFAFIVPNQCNDMHGRSASDGPHVPSSCLGTNAAALIGRGDDEMASLVAAIQASPIWTAPGENTAIVLTWDENDDEGRAHGPQTCCVAPDAHNPGGGRIPTIVIANHGPRGVIDPTPYDHYSLLRTIEDALGLGGHIGHAGDPGVLPMTPLFAVRS